MALQIEDNQLQDQFDICGGDCQFCIAEGNCRLERYLDRMGWESFERWLDKRGQQRQQQEEARP